MLDRWWLIVAACSACSQSNAAMVADGGASPVNPPLDAEPPVADASEATSVELRACGELVPVPMPTAAARYRVVVRERSIDPLDVPPRFSLDFDCDGDVDPISDPVMGAADRISIMTHDDVVFEYSLTSGPTQLNRILDVAVIELERGGYPSVVLAEADKANSWFYALPQHVLSNREGEISAAPIGVTLVGRAVDCTWIGSNERPLCFFASYSGVSALVELNSDGTGRNVTAEFGLPFPIPDEGWGTNGHHMIGAAFVDFSGDGIRDLVAVGQHSQIFTAVFADEGMAQTDFHGPVGEFRRVWAPRNGEAPCVYYAMERENPTLPTDYIECYDAGADDWYELALDPATEYEMVYRTVQFQLDPTDGAIIFLARTSEDRWDRLALVPDWSWR